jgi:Cof subfamily protein (haloacid dehalogenase superfamily)
MKGKGWIALDIDGTITNNFFKIPDNVVRGIKKIWEDGWKIIITTGRSYNFTAPILSCFDFPMVVSLQNGAVALEWPNSKILLEKYMDKPVLSIILEASKGIDVGVIIHAGIDNNDCFYYKNGNSFDYNGYVSNRQEKFLLKDSANNDLEGMEFPLVRCVGIFDEINKVKEKLEIENMVDFSLIKDPLDTRYHILLVTKKNVSKGVTVKDILQFYGDERAVVIAAGNDTNDISMLDMAHIGIAMSDAPKCLKDKADIIAKSAAEEGILPAINEAIKMVEYRK